MKRLSRPPPLMTPEEVLQLLDRYVAEYGFRLAKTSREVFELAERKAHALNRTMESTVYLWALFKVDRPFRQLLLAHAAVHQRGLERKLARLLIPEATLDDEEGVSSDLLPEDVYINPYTGAPYAFTKKPRDDIRESVVHLAMAVTRRERRTEIRTTAIIEALLLAHVQNYPVYNNGNWTDDGLHLPYLSLTHLAKSYIPELDVPFSAIFTHLPAVGPLPRKVLPR
jgi:hypothetical protein